MGISHPQPVESGPWGPRFIEAGHRAHTRSRRPRSQGPARIQARPRGARQRAAAPASDLRGHARKMQSTVRATSRPCARACPPLALGGAVHQVRRRGVSSGLGLGRQSLPRSSLVGCGLVFCEACCRLHRRQRMPDAAPRRGFVAKARPYCGAWLLGAPAPWSSSARNFGNSDKTQGSLLGTGGYSSLTLWVAVSALWVCFRLHEKFG